MMYSCGFGSIWTISVLFSFIYSNIADTKYSWNCATDGKGQKRIPDLDIHTSREIDFSNRNTLYIFSLPHLNDTCYGTITAIDYCYEYNGAGFNWTVLLLNSHFTILEMFHIENHSTVHQSSYNIIGRTAFQCDTLYIDGFDIPKTNFFFGVTDSVEGSGASLLTFHDSLYMVDAIVMPKDNLKLTRGSTIPATDSQSTLRGVRCLWFVIDADPPVSTTDTPDERGLIIGVGVGVVLGILVLLGVMTSVGIALIVKCRRNPPEIVEPLALGDWVDPQTQKGT